MNQAAPVIGVLLNYRDARRSEACVRALLGNGVAGVFVWDNSADGAVSSGELKRRLNDDERVYLHVSPINVGFAVGVNLAVERCLVQHPDAGFLSSIMMRSSTTVLWRPFARLCMNLRRLCLPLRKSANTMVCPEWSITTALPAFYFNSRARAAPVIPAAAACFWHHSAFSFLCLMKTSSCTAKTALWGFAIAEGEISCTCRKSSSGTMVQPAVAWGRAFTKNGWWRRI